MTQCAVSSRFSCHTFDILLEKDDVESSSAPNLKSPISHCAVLDIDRRLMVLFSLTGKLVSKIMRASWGSLSDFPKVLPINVIASGGMLLCYNRWNGSMWVREKISSMLLLLIWMCHRPRSFTGDHVSCESKCLRYLYISTHSRAWSWMVNSWHIATAKWIDLSHW